MTNEAGTLHAPAHPAPHRDRVGPSALAFGVIAGPLAWGVHLLVNYGIASHACFPGNVTRSAPPRGSDWLWPLLIGSDVIAIAIAAFAALISYRSWRITRREFSGHADKLIEIGESRTRFLALWGMMISAGFMVAMAFDVVGLWVVPICG